jgi:hypothetical protein
MPAYGSGHTFMKIRSISPFTILFLTFLCVLIDLCGHQLWRPCIAAKFSISWPLKMGPVLITEGDSRQTKTYTPSPQCIKANGAGAGASDNVKWTDKSAVGYGSNNLRPNRPAF